MEKKNLNLRGSYFWHKSLPKNHKPIMNIFHTIEFLILISVLSFYFNFLVFILIGMLFHSILDIIDLFYRKNLQVREFSLVRYIVLDKSKYF